MARITKAEQARIEAEAAAAEQKAVQAAELKRLRAVKAAAKKAEAEAAAQATVQQEAQRFDPKEEARKQFDRMASSLDAVMAEFEVPSWKRLLTATVVSLALAAGAGWLVGTVTGMLIVSAVALTGMAWVGYVIYVLGMIVGAYAGYKVCGVVGNYILSNKLDAQIIGVKNKFVSLFTAKPVEVFSGAHAA